MDTKIKKTFTDVVHLDEHGSFGIDFFEIQPEKMGELVVGGTNFIFCHHSGGGNNQCNNESCFNSACDNGNCVFVGVNPQCENVTCA